MASLYGFCREVDDVADEETVGVEEGGRRLGGGREDTRAACGGGEPRFAVNRELVPVIGRYGLSFEHFDELIRGVEMDLELNRYATWEELERYCYRVASVVGLLSIEVFGYRNPGCRDYAVALGKALQLTNILRDVKNDAERGRVYLPQEALDRHGVSVEEILAGRYSERFRSLAEEVAGRARSYYGKARSLLPAEDRGTMISAELMGAVYWQLLLRLEGVGFRVFGGSVVRLSKPMKLYLIGRVWMRSVLGSTRANYAG